MKILRNLKIFLLISVVISLSINVQSKEIKIITKIENEIITNIDVENEYDYLVALNKTLQEVDRESIFKFAKESLIKEKIKKYEILKYFELNQKNEMIDVMIQNIYQNLELNSQVDFENYLKNLDINFDDVYKKIEIEAVWNQMIYSKYRNKVIVNEEKIKQKLLTTPKKVELFLLSELIYDFKNQDEIETKYLEILESIKSIGFKESVINFSKADSRNNFGSLGWINKNALSTKIKLKLESMNVGEITDPIITPSGALILKVDNKKQEELNIDLDEEIKKIVQFETNTQLNNYSTLLFNKVKNNLSINEY